MGDIANTAFQALLQGGVGFAVGPLVDSVFPDFDAGKHGDSEPAGMALGLAEVTAQIIVATTAGNILADILTPSNAEDPVSGLIYQWALWETQPQLRVKMATLAANMQLHWQNWLGIAPSGAAEQPMPQQS